MAALALPITHDLVVGARRPVLHVVGGGAGRRPSPAVRRRRRLVAAAGAVLLLVALLLGARQLAAPSTAGDAAAGGAVSADGAPRVRLAGAPVAAPSHIVQPGDSLWSIARSLQPDGDVRPLVDRLAAQRGGRALQVGERIRL